MQAAHRTRNHSANPDGGGHPTIDARSNEVTTATFTDDEFQRPHDTRVSPLFGSPLTLVVQVRDTPAVAVPGYDRYTGE